MGKTADINDGHSVKALQVLSRVILLGLLGTATYGLHASNVSESVAFAVVGVMIGVAALFIGGLLGFVFGIPRTLQDIHAELKTLDQDVSQIGRDHGIDYRANTNLEQISDWLTKILVGVGLTQVTVIPSKLQQVADAAAPALGNSDS